MTEFPRRSGVLLHITSLPGPYGIGEIGPHAYAFIDLLQEMGQSLWQILPVIDTGNHKSPYTTISAFANNPLLISFNLLVDDKLLEDSELEALPNFTDDRVDFDSVVPARSAVLDTVCEMFDKRATKKQNQPIIYSVKRTLIGLKTMPCLRLLRMPMMGQSGRIGIRSTLIVKTER